MLNTKVKIVSVILVVLCLGVSVPAYIQPGESQRSPDSIKIYGQTNAEQLGELSVIDILFRKRRKADCDESEKEVIETPPAIESGPLPIESEPLPIESGPPAIDSGPPAIESGPPAIESGPPAIESGPPPIENIPPPIENIPPPIESGLAAIEIGPRAIESGPAAVSVEEVKLVSYEEISSAEIGGAELRSKPSPVTDYLTPPAEGANCTNYGTDPSSDVTTVTPEIIDVPFNETLLTL